MLPKVQFSLEYDKFPTLKKEGINLVESIVSEILCFCRMKYNLALVATHDVGSQQSTPVSKKN